jgi:hypothetical protein
VRARSRVRSGSSPASAHQKGSAVAEDEWSDKKRIADALRIVERLANHRRGELLVRQAPPLAAASRLNTFFAAVQVDATRSVDERCDGSLSR